MRGCLIWNDSICAFSHSRKTEVGPRIIKERLQRYDEVNMCINIIREKAARVSLWSAFVTMFALAAAAFAVAPARIGVPRRKRWLGLPRRLDAVLVLCRCVSSERARTSCRDSLRSSPRSQRSPFSSLRRRVLLLRLRIERGAANNTRTISV